MAGVVFRGFTNDNPGHKAGDDGSPDAHPVGKVEGAEHEERGDDNQHGADVNGPAEGAHQLSLVGPGLCPDKVDAEDGEQGACGGNDHRGDNRLVLDIRIPVDVGSRSKGGGGQDRPAVGFVQIRSHARDIAHVVPHVVRDGGRVAGIILGDAGLDLADKVRAHVRSLGEDAASDTRKERLQGGPHAEGQHGRGNDGHLFLGRTGVDPAVEDEKPDGNVE